MRLLVLVAIVFSAASASAQPPDTLTHYNLISSRSVFVQSGGFAGVEQRYQLQGEYDFLEEWTGGTATDPLQLTARFDNADLQAPLGPMLPAFIDVDDLLNLEGLRGELLPLGAPFDVYRFKGFINDSAAASPLEQSMIELYAAKYGRWMFLYGETTQPVGSADRFEYQIKALARTGPWADLSGDGVVDLADYTLWRDRGRDATGIGYADWKSQFGETAPDDELVDAMMVAAVSAADAVAAVPEPAGLLLIACGAVAGLRGRRR